jgi:c-di-AMP phosphodiesterase-like protein
MNKQKARKLFVYLLLAFVLFLYVFSIIVFLFGDPATAIYVFAYSTFFTIIVYFLIILQRRVETNTSLFHDAKEAHDDQKNKSQDE